MRATRARVVILLLIIALAVGGFLYYRHAASSAKYQTREEASNIYVRFAMEAYDSIQKNYWMPHTGYDLPKIYELSFEKVMHKQGIAAPTDRAGTAAAVAAALKLATSTEAEKADTLQALTVVLYNLEPVARDGLMSNQQVTALRDEVSNKNPETGAVQPTVASKTVGKTLYVRLSLIAPTTLQEFADAVNAASSTPLDSLIIDLRGNIGGDLEFMPAFLGLWIGQDQYAFDLYAQGNKNVIRTTQGKYDPLSKLETAVLVDGQTQSTAELTADAFRRYRLGTIVGTKSKGWGTVENTYPLSTQIDPSTSYALYLVNSLTVRDDNQPIEGNGVAPDLDTSTPGWPGRLPGAFHSASLIAALRSIAATSTPAR